MSVKKKPRRPRGIGDVPLPEFAGGNHAALVRLVDELELSLKATAFLMGCRYMRLREYYYGRKETPLFAVFLVKFAHQRFGRAIEVDPPNWGDFPPPSRYTRRMRKGVYIARDRKQRRHKLPCPMIEKGSASL